MTEDIGLKDAVYEHVARTTDPGFRNLFESDGFAAWVDDVLEG